MPHGLLSRHCAGIHRREGKRRIEEAPRAQIDVAEPELRLQVELVLQVCEHLGLQPVIDKVEALLERVGLRLSQAEHALLAEPFRERRPRVGKAALLLLKALVEGLLLLC